MALVVARPIVLGEDPGMQAAPTDTGSLVLTLFWMLIGLGLAAWCARTRRPFGRFDTVEWALLAVTACMFISSQLPSTSYKHPARLIVGDWLGFAMIYLVTRRLAATPGERDGWVNALLASGVAIAAFGIYQGAYELPRDRQLLGRNTEQLRLALARQNVFLNADDPQLQIYRKRLLDNHVFGTYSHPNSYAGVLALMVPGLIGAAWIGWRSRSSWWQIALLVGCALVGIGAVWMTHSRGAILALALVGLLSLAVWQWQLLWRWRLITLAGLLLLVAAGWGLLRTGALTSGLNKEEGGLKVRLEYWQATAKMIAERPWWGFGPGNFGNAYPRFMSPTAAEQIKDPHNFVLETWASAGVLAALALLVALGMGLWNAANGLRSPTLPVPLRAGDEGAPSDIPWTIYFAGMVGLLLGFALRAGDFPPDAIVHEALAAAARSVVWFATFALLSTVRWTDRARTTALTAGIGAMLLNLCVSGGISFPAVAGLLWVALALVAPTPASISRTPRFAGFIPLPVMAAAVLFYFLNVFYPVTTAATSANKGLVAGSKLLDDESRGARGGMSITAQSAADFLRKQVLTPFERAAREDPDNAWIHVQVANWYGQLWARSLVDRASWQRALAAAELAEKLNPEGPIPRQTHYHLFFLFGEKSQLVADNVQKQDPARAAKHREEAKNQYGFAAETLRRYLPFDPHDPRLRFQLAEALLLAGNEKEARQQGRVAQELDAKAGIGSTRSLSRGQRTKLEDMLTPVPSK